jgi:hypothetical protein
VVNDIENDTRSAYLIANGVVSDLPTVPHYPVFPGYARGLNDSDQIVGSYLNGQSFLATPGPGTGLGSPARLGAGRDGPPATPEKNQTVIGIHFVFTA